MPSESTRLQKPSAINSQPTRLRACRLTIKAPSVAVTSGMTRLNSRMLTSAPRLARVPAGVPQEAGTGVLRLIMNKTRVTTLNATTRTSAARARVDRLRDAVD